MPDRTRYVEIERDALIRRGIPPDRLPHGRYRVRCTFEPDELTGQDAISYDLERFVNGAWAAWPTANDETESEPQVRAIEAAAQDADPGLVAWMGEWNIFEETDR